MRDLTNYDDYVTILNALKKFQDNLTLDYNVLVNAANVCDTAMGSDEIAKTYILFLGQSLKKLEFAQNLCSDTIKKIDRKRIELERIIHDLEAMQG